MSNFEMGADAVNGAIIGVSAGSLYDCPSTMAWARFDNARLVNYGGATPTVDLWVLQSGETTAGANWKIVDTYVMSVDETYVLDMVIGDAIQLGGSIYGQASAGSEVAFAATVTLGKV